MIDSNNTIDEEPRWRTPRAVYIHIPFCAHHCGYCDFAVAVGRDDVANRYLDALETEIQRSGTIQRPMRSIFLGGGTPSHVSDRQLQRLMTMIRRHIPKAEDCEFSIEANPDSLTSEKIALLSEFGVNRISLGAQSFHKNLLHVLERSHRPDEVADAVDRIRRFIGNFSIDLIFGVPGQLLKQWKDDLNQALKLNPSHISTYGLTFEKGTKLWKQLRAGSLERLPEERELAMYEHAMETLEAVGWSHYEISNFAKPNRECRHNHVYWANHAYHGFGMGAARYIDGRRELNTRSLDVYLQRISDGQSPTIQTESLNDEERARETIAMNLRRARGVNYREFREQTNFDANELARNTIDRFVESGHLTQDCHGFRFTNQGKCVADHIIERFWASFIGTNPT